MKNAAKPAKPPGHNLNNRQRLERLLRRMVSRNMEFPADGFFKNNGPSSVPYRRVIE